jgi:hypothetical protein
MMTDEEVLAELNNAVDSMRMLAHTMRDARTDDPETEASESRITAREALRIAEATYQLAKDLATVFTEHASEMDDYVRVLDQVHFCINNEGVGGDADPGGVPPSPPPGPSTPESASQDEDLGPTNA